jgi:chromosomal replication initiator protein
VRLATIIDAVCTRLTVTKADLMGSSRHRRVVLARALVAYLGRELTTHSFPEIAQSLGRNNHSTIHTADQRLRKQLEANEPLDLGGADCNLNLRELADQLRRDVTDRK